MIDVRIQQKFDTLASWNSDAAKTKVLLKGELAIVQVPSSSTAIDGDIVRPQYLIKVGDGITQFQNLQWLSAKAADVYDWAKADTKPSYRADEIDGLSDYISGEIKDTNTTYQIIKNGDMGFKLQGKEVNGTWTDVSTIALTAPVYTLESGTTNGTVKFNGTEVSVAGLKSAAFADASAFDTAGAAGAVQSDLNAYKGTNDAAISELQGAINTLNGTGDGSVKKTAEDAAAAAVAGVVASAPEDFDTLKEVADWIKSDTTGAAKMQSDISDLKDDQHTHANKTIIDGITSQKITNWDNAESNAKSYTDDEIKKLDKTDNAVAGQVVSAVSETDGVITVSRRALIAADIPNLAASKITGLADVATSGYIEDLSNNPSAPGYVIFNCGSATTVI